MIERIRGVAATGRSDSTAYKDLVWSVATASDKHLDLSGQTLQTLNKIENNLIELGSDKTNIVSAYVFLSNSSDKPITDEVWREWIGADPGTASKSLSGRVS